MQVTSIIAVGSLIANLVCYTISPRSAAENLQDNMSKTLDSCAPLLSMLTNTFLLVTSPLLHQPSQNKLQRAINSHQELYGPQEESLRGPSGWLCSGPTVPGAKGTITQRGRTRMSGLHEPVRSALGWSTEWYSPSARPDAGCALRESRVSAPEECEARAPVVLASLGARSTRSDEG